VYLSVSSLLFQAASHENGVDCSYDVQQEQDVEFGHWHGTAARGTGGTDSKPWRSRLMRGYCLAATGRAVLTDASAS
jgi:hypothetical protein